MTVTRAAISPIIAGVGVSPRGQVSTATGKAVANRARSIEVSPACVPARSPATIASPAPTVLVTNGINVMLELSRHKDLRLICLGGSFHPESGSMVGPLAEEALAKLTIQKLFLGTQALDLEHGLTDSTMEIAQVKWAMIRAARQVVLVTDASKWGHAGFIKVAPLADIDTLIVDAALPDDARAAIEQLGIELVIA